MYTYLYQSVPICPDFVPILPIFLLCYEVDCERFGNNSNTYPELSLFLGFFSLSDIGISIGIGMTFGYRYRYQFSSGYRYRYQGISGTLTSHEKIYAALESFITIRKSFYRGLLLVSKINLIKHFLID